MSKSAKMFVERLWGHAGVEFPASPKKLWMPISQGEASRLERVMNSGRRPSGWLIVRTLNNRLKLLNPAHLECFSLLDDADEWPEGEEVFEGGLEDYAGMPAELYQRMAEWADDDSEFEGNNSDAEKKEALFAIERGGFLGRRAALEAALRHIVIHYASGKTRSYTAAWADLCNLIDIEWDVDAEIVKISERGSVERYYALDKLYMIDIPLIELNAAQRQLSDDSI